MTKIILTLWYHWKAVLGWGLAVMLALTTLLLSRADAWVQDYQHFPEGEATVVVDRFCRTAWPPTSGRVDPCDYHTEQAWRSAIRTALQAWNAAGAGFRFHERAARAGEEPCRGGQDGTVYIILAHPNEVCLNLRALTADARADSGFRPQVSWVYINALQTAARDMGAITRLLTHELGHVVGLGHPDEAGQSVPAIMNSVIYYDHLQPDDIAGVQALYGTQQEPEALVGFLGNPRDGSSHSGVSVISGWVCEAETVEIQIWSPNGGPVVVEPAAYGTSRPDTAYRPDGTILCGDTDNGFGLLFNWNNREEGEHIVDVLVDGELLDRATVYLTNFGTDFLRGASGRYVLEDFPDPGESVVIEWEEALQNFVIVERR